MAKYRIYSDDRGYWIADKWHWLSFAWYFYALAGSKEGLLEKIKPKPKPDYEYLDL